MQDSGSLQGRSETPSAVRPWPTVDQNGVAEALGQQNGLDSLPRRPGSAIVPSEAGKDARWASSVFKDRIGALRGLVNQSPSMPRPQSASGQLTPGNPSLPQVSNAWCVASYGTAEVQQEQVRHLRTARKQISCHVICYEFGVCAGIPAFRLGMSPEPSGARTPALLTAAEGNPGTATRPTTRPWSSSRQPNRGPGLFGEATPVARDGLLFPRTAQEPPQEPREPPRLLPAPASLFESRAATPQPSKLGSASSTPADPS